MQFRLILIRTLHVVLLIAIISAAAPLYPNATPTALGADVANRPDSFQVVIERVPALLNVETLSEKVLPDNAGVGGAFGVGSPLGGLFMYYEVARYGDTDSDIFVPNDWLSGGWERIKLLPPGISLVYRSKLTSVDQHIKLTTRVNSYSIIVSILFELLKKVPGLAGVTDSKLVEGVVSAVDEVGLPAVGITVAAQALLDNPTIDLGTPGRLTDLVNAVAELFSKDVGKQLIQKIVIKLGRDTGLVETIVKQLSNWTLVYTVCKFLVDDLWVLGTLIARGGDPNSYVTISGTTFHQGMPPVAPPLKQPNGPYAQLKPLFKWNSVLRAAQYSLQVSTSRDFGSFVLNETTTSTEYTPPFNLAADTTYYWRVAAINAYGNASQFNVMDFRTGPAFETPPDNDDAQPTTDAARFTGTELPNDAYVAQPNGAFRKMWQVQNTGSTTWNNGYRLVFVSGIQMGAPSEVAIPAASPQQVVTVGMDIVAPSEPGVHRGYWQLRNAQGTFFGQQLWVQVTVPGQAPSPNPNSSQTTLTCLNCLATMAPGQTYRPTLHVALGDGRLSSSGDMLRNTDGNLFGGYPHIAVDHTIEAGQQIDFTFYADNPFRAPDTPGVYTSTWRLWRNGGWYGPEYTIRFEVKAGGGNRAPYPPTLTSPHDWAVYTGNGGIVLSAQQNGDPDGDPITHYYFEISGQQTANSGWITSNSWSPQGLGYYGYQWRVKVRDSQNVESGWSSQTWNFSVQTNEPQIYEFYATQCRAAWDNGNTEKLCFCARTNAGTIKVQVNSATDGSDRGEWEVINELGSSSWSCSSDSDRPPTWDHLRYESGRHLVRLYARRDGGWAAAANRDIYVDLSTARRPNSPSVTLPLWEGYVNSRTILIDWRDTLRTSSYRLQVATDPGLANLVLDTTVSASVSQYQHTFAADYPNLYGRVTAVGPYGTNTGDLRFQIDRTPPQSAVSALPLSVYDTQFGVQWGGSDGQSGLNWYHVQVRDGSRAESSWVDWLVNTTRTAEIFTGLPGHTYFFRVRAMDNIGNWEDWPANADASTTIDPAARPPETWWNTGYQKRRSITVLNGMGSRELPVGYPLHLRLDGSTTPTAQAVYDGLLAGSPCTDLRVIYNNSSELLRYIPVCTRDQIDIWFQNQAALGANASDGVSYRLYYGNAAAGSVQNDATQVLPPVRDANTKGLWYFSEGAGSTFADSSGNNNTGSLRGLVWGEGLFGGGLVSQEHAAGNGAMVPGSASLSSSVFTLEFYARRADNDNTTIMGQGQAGNDRERVRLWIESGGRIKYQVDPAPGGASDIWANSGCLPDLAWHHVAVTFDGYRTGTIFCDGVQMASALFNEVGIGAYNFDLFFGSDFTTATRFKGWIDQVRLSNVVRTSFPHGTFALITTLPSVAVGDFVPAPLTGDSNLAVESLRVFNRSGGGYIAEAVVRNLGTKSTLSGFYTDLYIDHAPIGPGDYSGSVQFWVNSPIAAGAALTLTAPLPAITAVAAAQEPGAAPNDASAAGAAPAEVTRTLYVQTDSTGAVRESDRSNNVTAGYEVCTAAADGFEPDDSAAAAKTLVLGAPQTHNFSSAADGDWLRFRTTAGVTYTFSTGNLGLAADTYLHLYSPDQSTLLDSNDDSFGSLASSITWQAPAGDDYYLLVRSWNPNVQGCGTSYNVRVDLTSALAPSSGFTAISRQGIAPFAVQFIDLSQGQVTAWQWAFGDGQTSTEQNPRHTYQLPGSYTVELTVTGPGGTHKRTEVGYIVVNEAISIPRTYLYLPGIVK